MDGALVQIGFFLTNPAGYFLGRMAETLSQRQKWSPKVPSRQLPKAHWVRTLLINLNPLTPLLWGLAPFS
jgi:hypothetical protein